MSVLNSPPEPGYTRVFENPAGGFVDVHEHHGKHESRQNLLVALFFATRGEQVCLLGVRPEAGRKNPDATRNGVVCEFKMPEGRTVNAIDKALRDGSRQAARVLLALPVDFDHEALEQGLYDRVQRTAHLLEVAVLLGETLHSFHRQQIVSQAFRGTMT